MRPEVSPGSSNTPRDELLLTRLQLRFQQHVLHPDEDPLADLVLETPQVPRATRLHIYSNAYRERMIEAMDADFHQLHVLLGDEGFSTLIKAYLAAHPSRYPSVRWFGTELAHFLRHTPPYDQHPELAELAEFEWALCHAFDAANSNPLELAQLTAIAPEAFEGLKLGFHPSLQMLTLHSAAPVVWQALNQNPETTPPSFDWKGETSNWLVWRQELRLMFRPATVEETWALAAFRRDLGFGEVCEGLCRWYPEDQVPGRAVAFLQQWLNDELIVSFNVA